MKKSAQFFEPVIRPVLLVLTAVLPVTAEDVHWITGPGNNTEIEIRYGTATQPLRWFDPGKWFSDVAEPQTPNGAVPIDGQSVAHSNSCCNPEPFVDINNGGAGVSLPNSSIRFDAKTNLFDSSAGDLSDVAGGSYDLNLVDDVLEGGSIAFNGAGGRANDIFVPVIAKTLTSNRHGAVFNAPISVETILAHSSHQDKWQINASPAAPLVLIELDENRGPDGGTIDGFFAVNADLTVETLDHVWSRLVVGPGATLTVGTYRLTSYASNPAPNNNTPPLELNGEMYAETFTFGEADQGSGTWGGLGSGADNEVDWITGGGLLTVGGGGNQEPQVIGISVEENRESITLVWSSSTGKNYSILYSPDLAKIDRTVVEEVPSQGDTTMLTFDNPESSSGVLYFSVVENE